MYLIKGRLALDIKTFCRLYSSVFETNTDLHRLAPVPSGSGIMYPLSSWRRVTVVSPNTRQSVSWCFLISNSSVDCLRSIRLRASVCRRPAPSGPGLRVHRRIVARGCWWLFETAPGIDGVFGIGGAVSGGVVGHVRAWCRWGAIRERRRGYTGTSYRTSSTGR